MREPVHFPEAQDFVRAIAQPFDSDAGARVVAPFGIAWGEGVKLDSGLEVYNFSEPAVGLDLTFKDEGVVRERAYHDAGDGPFLLTQCAFWGHEEGYESYKGPLFEGLRFSDTVAEAQRKLGPPSRVGRMDIHFWELPEFRLTVQWKSADKVRVVTYWMKQG
jgi:hypothetical protein